MTVRVFIPLTTAALAVLAAERRLAAPLAAHAVTDALRAQWPEADQEQAEYAALMAAAAASRQQAGGVPARRVVVAADVASVSAVADDDPTRVEVPGDIPWAAIAAAHLDVEVGADEDDDLAWFATQEIPGLV